LSVSLIIYIICMYNIYTITASRTLNYYWRRVNNVISEGKKYTLTLKDRRNRMKGMIKASRKNGCKSEATILELDGFPKEKKITFLFFFLFIYYYYYYFFFFLATFLCTMLMWSEGGGALVRGVSCQKRAKNKQSTTHPTVNAFKVIGNKQKKTTIKTVSIQFPYLRKSACTHTRKTGTSSPENCVRFHGP
jgi:hypothetical protein